VPTYEYRCDHCARNFDVVQSFQDDPLSECPTCGNPVRKVFGSVGIVFKGSGFYKTDSRSGGGSASRIGDTTAPAAESTSATPDGSKDSSTTDKSTAPAAPAAPAPSPKVPAGSSSTSGGSGSGSAAAAPA
jgi:putative FmdB family regulatory protein